MMQHVPVKIGTGRRVTNCWSMPLAHILVSTAQYLWLTIYYLRPAAFSFPISMSGSQSLNLQFPIYNSQT